jgi:signal transduction histidine kinase
MTRLGQIGRMGYNCDDIEDGGRALAADTDGDAMAQWREQFLVSILRYALLCGAVVALPSLWSALRTGVPSVIVVDLSALGWLLVLWRMRTWPYAVRAWGFLLLIYAIGTWFLANVGVVSLIYLAAFPVMASVLLGLRGAVLTLAMNGVTLMAVGSLAGLSPQHLPGVEPVPLFRWFIITLNFLFVNSIITTAIALVLRRLEAALDRQRVANAGLQREVRDRQRAEEEVRQLNARLEERVRERTRQLQEANQEMEAYSYTVSHDLRGPLNAINGFSHILQKTLGANAPAQAIHSLARIRANVTRMSDLIEALLSLAQLSRAAVRRAPVDLSAVAREILAGHAEAEPGRQVRIGVQDGLMVLGDARLLRALLENLLGNAWKFTGRQPAAEIDFGQDAPADGGSPAFFVRDNGAGFDMAYADKLFGTFQRLHAAEEFPGTGIGLATVRRIVSLHGGRVWAHSQVGVGTTFFFTLGTAAGELPAESRTVPAGSA